jgi:peroxin-6
MLYLGVSDSHEAQINILEALTRKFRLDPDFDLSGLANQCPFNFTGADFYALCADALLKAMSRKAMELEEKIGKAFLYLRLEMTKARLCRLEKLRGGNSCWQSLTPQRYLLEMVSAEEASVIVSRADFELALQELVPSVTQSELEEYANIQKRFSRGLVDDN